MFARCSPRWPTRRSPVAGWSTNRSTTASAPWSISGPPRAGDPFGSTRAEARQLVTHGAIAVNGKRLDIPSALLKGGEAVGVVEKSKTQLRIIDAVQLAEKVGFPAWVEVDPKKLSGTFKGAPDRSEFGQDINESLVVELYSK